jgi:hypothetical protein
MFENLVATQMFWSPEKKNYKGLGYSENLECWASLDKLKENDSDAAISGNNV